VVFVGEAAGIIPETLMEVAISIRDRVEDLVDQTLIVLPEMFIVQVGYL